MLFKLFRFDGPSGMLTSFFWKKPILNPRPLACKASDLPLIYRPVFMRSARLCESFLKNKEVIQPHVPVRLPCLSNGETMVIHTPDSSRCSTRGVVIPNKGMHLHDVLQGQPARLAILRLSPPCRTLTRLSQSERASSKIHSDGLTGSVCKEQERIRRWMLTSDY